MIFNKEDAETLAAIGLTSAQAKIYLTLASLEEAKVKIIWKNSGVARQDIYRILTELQEKGLVEKIVAAPTKYKALPIQDALAILLKHKAHEYKESEKKAKQLFDRFRTSHQENTTAKDYEFRIITTKDATRSEINKASIHTKKSVDIIDSWDSFKYFIVVYAEQIITGAKRNVKFRFITDKPKDGETTPKIFQTWKKNGWVELRHITTQPPTSIRIEDGEQVTICIVTAGHAVEAPCLFSDNPCLVAILQDYFEILWSKATEGNT